MLQRLVSLVGRLMITPIFLFSGVAKIQNWHSTVGMLEGQGIPAESAPFFLAGAVGLELLGGLAVLFGWHARLGALLLILFLAPTTLIFHDFWIVEDATQRMNEMQHFMKNLAIMGGLFVVLGLGAGALSFDARRAKKNKKK